MTIDCNAVQSANVLAPAKFPREPRLRVDKFTQDWNALPLIVVKLGGTVKEEIAVP